MATTLHRDSWDQYVAIVEKEAADMRAEIERLRGLSDAWGDINEIKTAEIERLTAENERLASPIGMQDVRLIVGEGKLSAWHVLQAVNVILRQRRERVTCQQLIPQKEKQE